ncbi:maleylpyruvate isomerase family mycothiol-dependent enzyme [Geodermatophilus sp. URMC 64]
MTSLAGERLRQRCIEAVVEEGERFGVLAAELAAGLTPADGGLDTRVPWVPAWSARDLVGHLGAVHRWATAIVRAGTTEGPPRAVEPPDGDLLDWYAAGHTELVRALRTVPPGSPAWHMSPAAPKVAASWARRQAHELAVHRMDLEAAAGVPHAPLDPELAEDGVDELLGIVVPRWAHTEPLVSAEAVVAVTDTDTGRQWEVRVTHGAVQLATEHSGAAGARLSGAGTELLLHLWGRPAEVRVEGDAAAEALLRGR